MTSINICKAIECPYFCPNPQSGYGCRKYAVALQCHLIYPVAGIKNEGFDLTTQYTLMAESADGLKELNENYLRSDDQYLKDVEIFDLFANEPSHYPNRILKMKYKRIKFSKVEIGDAFFLILPDGKHPAFKLTSDRAGYPAGMTTTLREVRVALDQIVEVSA